MSRYIFWVYRMWDLHSINLMSRSRRTVSPYLWIRSPVSVSQRPKHIFFKQSPFSCNCHFSTYTRKYRIPRRTTTHHSIHWSFCRESHMSHSLLDGHSGGSFPDESRARVLAHSCQRVKQSPRHLWTFCCSCCRCLSFSIRHGEVAARCLTRAKISRSKVPSYNDDDDRSSLGESQSSLMIFSINHVSCYTYPWTPSYGTPMISRQDMLS